MTAKGFYQWEKDGQIKTAACVRFESTGIKDEEGKIIWRRIDKNGNRTNRFAEQFQPNMPWAHGKWFCKRDTEATLKKYPELRIEE